jgi:mono/diheme cytochrome c family protein
VSSEQLWSAVASAARHRFGFAHEGTALEGENRSKAPSPLRSAGALQILSVRKVLLLLLTAHCLLLTTSCRQDMQDQPKYVTYRASGFFRDGLSSRPLVEGTVARGFLRADREFYTGKKNGVAGASRLAGMQTPQPGAMAPGVGQTANTTSGSGSPSALYPDDVDTFPFAITTETMNRGQERYQIFCAVCHGGTGNGDGLVVRRGFRLPPTYHSDQMRQAPVGHYFDVITNGWGAMPSYAAQIPPADRWAIIAYIRALQLSQLPNSTPAQTQPGAAGATEPNKGHAK